tara:strand:- start:362 stop:1018 length:657 start_codon:yes stop_codon:yes gene_type:complete
MSKEGKKKRGRKPKNKIVTPKEIQDINKDKDNKIICIKVKKDNLSQDNILPGYVKENYELDEQIKDIHCWNCCSKLDRSYKSLPIKYINGQFYIYGHFCDISCSLRYLYDHFHGKELWSKYELFHFYCYKIYGTTNIHPAPDRLSLKMFGGNLTIEEYKKNNINYNEINIPPIIPVDNPKLKYENKKINENKGELKLYRKKIKENKGGILNNMNIQKI